MFACGNYIFPKTRGNKNYKPWTHSTPLKGVLQIVLRDRNAQLGNDTSTWSPVLRHHTEGDLNDNGIRLLSFCQAHNLVVGSSLFLHKRIHKLTWNSPNGRTCNLINHTLVNRKWQNSLKYIFVLRSKVQALNHIYTNTEELSWTFLERC